MKTFNSGELNGLLEQHKLWLSDSAKGKRADLRFAYLIDADLEGANLSNADLRDADLEGANLIGADLSNANLRDANLIGADLSNANLRDANLSNANLRDANLSNVDLSNVNLNGCIGNGSEIQSIQTPKYLINITKEDIQIGCERHTIDAWLSFSDNVIQDMDRGALDWWKMYKPILASLLNVKLG